MLRRAGTASSSLPLYHLRLLLCPPRALTLAQPPRIETTTTLRPTSPLTSPSPALQPLGAEQLHRRLSLHPAGEEFSLEEDRREEF